MLRELTYFSLLCSFCLVIPIEMDSNYRQGFVGGTVQLPCSIDTKQCGNLRSILWCRHPYLSIIYTFDVIRNFSYTESDRFELLYTPNSTMSYLEIKDLNLEDDTLYDCQVIYDLFTALPGSRRQSCHLIQSVRLFTVIKPEFVRIINENGTELANTSTIVPLKEDVNITLTCESGGGKPIPSVAWWNGTHKVDGINETEYADRNETGLRRNRIRVNLSRKNVGVRYECRVSNDALETPMTSWVEIKAKEKPTVELTMYPPTPVNELDNENITMHCQVVSGHPHTLLAVRWYVNGELLKELPERELTPNSSFCDVAPSKMLLENVDRSFHGNYSCMGRNEAGWGNMSSNTEVIVHYKPECEVTQEKEGTKLILICTAKANPTDVEFTWKTKKENRTTNEKVRNDHLRSVLTLGTEIDSFRTYVCYVNSSLGMATQCEIYITANISWWEKLENDNRVIIVAIIAGAVLTVVILCKIAINMRRRKYDITKYVQYVSSTGKDDNISTRE